MSEQRAEGIPGQGKEAGVRPQRQEGDKSTVQRKLPQAGCTGTRMKAGSQ